MQNIYKEHMVINNTFGEQRPSTVAPSALYNDDACYMR